MGDTRACRELSIELAADYETVTVLEQLVEHLVAVRFAICQMDGIFAAIELLGRHSDLPLPPLVLNAGWLGAPGPRLEGSNAERLASAIGCQCERNVSEQDLSRRGLGALSAPETSSLAIEAVRERRRIVHDQVVAASFAARASGLNVRG